MAQFETKQAAWEYYLNLDSHHFEEKQHNNIYTDTFEAGAEWNQKRLLEKACEYLESVLKHDLGYYRAAEFVDNFRKEMEE